MPKAELKACRRCKRMVPADEIERRHMSTAYAPPRDEENYCEVCLECFDEIEGYWKERWDEYYSMVM